MEQRSFPIFFVCFKVEINLRALCWSRISPQWLSELRWPWESIPWPVVCDFVSLMGYHTIPGQHNQPTLTLFGRRSSWLVGSRVYACLAVTCHLYFWQNDKGLLCAPVVTQGWNRYWSKSQHRKLTLEKKGLPFLLSVIKPAAFWSQVRRSTTELHYFLLKFYMTNGVSRVAWKERVSLHTSAMQKVLFVPFLKSENPFYI